MGACWQTQAAQAAPIAKADPASGRNRGSPLPALGTTNNEPNLRPRQPAVQPAGRTRAAAVRTSSSCILRSILAIASLRRFAVLNQSALHAAGCGREKGQAMVHSGREQGCTRQQ